MAWTLPGTLEAGTLVSSGGISVVNNGLLIKSGALSLVDGPLYVKAGGMTVVDPADSGALGYVHASSGSYGGDVSVTPPA